MIFQAIFVILQPRSQVLSSLPSLVVGTETLVAAGHVILVYILFCCYQPFSLDLVEEGFFLFLGETICLY